MRWFAERKLWPTAGSPPMTGRGPQLSLGSDGAGVGWSAVTACSVRNLVAGNFLRARW